MAHLSRNISDSENPVVSYQPSWFDDGAAAQLHRVSQLRWIDLYIYISIIARRWFGTCVAGSYRWAAGLLENPHHQNRWFSQRYTSILSGDFPSSHVWLRRACLKILGGHPPFPRPCGGRQPIFTKKKLCAPSWCQDWESPCELWQRNTPTLDKLDKPPNVAVVSTDFSVITAVKIFTSRP